MKRTEYKGYIIDTDNLGRPYIYYTASPYSEESDRILVNVRTLKEAKKIIDLSIQEDELERQYFEELAAEGQKLIAQRSEEG